MKCSFTAEVMSGWKDWGDITGKEIVMEAVLCLRKRFLKKLIEEKLPLHVFIQLV